MISVKAAKGHVVPMEGHLKKSYSETEPTLAADSAYIRRRIADGSLIVVSDKKTNKSVEVNNGK